jgi:hypothetical protein
MTKGSNETQMQTQNNVICKAVHRNNTALQTYFIDLKLLPRCDESFTPLAYYAVLIGC